MFDIVPRLLILFAFSALLLTWGMEMGLSATWNKLYFNSGILMLVKNFRVDVHHSNIPSRSLFENKFKAGCLGLTRSLIFEELAPNVYGFRESLFPLKRMSLLHGVIVFDNENNQVTVKGFLDWTVLCFVLIALIIPGLAWLFGYIELYEPTWLSALTYFGFLFVGLGFFYLIDYVRFSEVAEFAAQFWSRKHLDLTEG